MDLITQAEETYKKHFPPTACFERALFFSWYCSIRDCTFCFMSTQPKDVEPQKMRRSTESLIAEALLCRFLGWDSGFLSGGINAFSPTDMKKLLPLLVAAYRKKFWLNIGPLSLELLDAYKPHLAGVVGAIETVNPLVHKKICPSKPMEPYLNMFEAAHTRGIQNAMTFIVGVGETQEDLPLLLHMIEKYHISKIHIYSLVPEKGTSFTKKDIPSPEYQAWWIAHVRIRFPTIHIQCGIWKDRISSLALLLRTGANSFSKFPATRLFGTAYAYAIEEQVRQAGRVFQGTLTQLPNDDWEKEIQMLPADNLVKEKVRKKINQYLCKIGNNLHRYAMPMQELH